MSYVRWGEEGSDVYIYGSSTGIGSDTQIVCCACSTERDEDGMLAHIALHRERGDFVPQYVDEELINDRDVRLATGEWPEVSLRWERLHGKRLHGKRPPADEAAP